VLRRRSGGYGHDGLGEISCYSRMEPGHYFDSFLFCKLGKSDAACVSMACFVATVIGTGLTGYKCEATRPLLHRYLNDRGIPEGQS
jgi:hypothetical protein